MGWGKGHRGSGLEKIITPKKITNLKKIFCLTKRVTPMEENVPLAEVFTLKKKKKRNSLQHPSAMFPRDSQCLISPRIK